ncbi:unnamed protein product, partial [Didymodactylos carnosus]
IRHAALSLTSCFPRESYLGSALRWCHGKKYVLQQFITWYHIEQSLRVKNTLTVNDIFIKEHCDEKYLNYRFTESFNATFLSCCKNQNVVLNTNTQLIYFARYRRGLVTYHSRAYSRSGRAISYYVCVKSDLCPAKRETCFAEILVFFKLNDTYASIKEYSCIDRSLTDGLTCTASTVLMKKLNEFYAFFNDKHFSYKIVLVSALLDKAIRIPWNEKDLSVFTNVALDWEHD